MEDKVGLLPALGLNKEFKELVLSCMESRLLQVSVKNIQVTQIRRSMNIQAQTIVACSNKDLK